MGVYEVIWVHRGLPDHRAIQTALKELVDGRNITMAPEGCYSLVGGLKQGIGVAPYLSLEDGVPVIPLTVNGMKNEYVFGFIGRLGLVPVTFPLAEYTIRRVAVR